MVALHFLYMCLLFWSILARPSWAGTGSQATYNLHCRDTSMTDMFTLTYVGIQVLKLFEILAQDHRNAALFSLQLANEAAKSPPHYHHSKQFESEKRKEVAQHIGIAEELDKSQGKPNTSMFCFGLYVWIS